MVVAKSAVTEYLARPRKSYDWIKALSRADLVTELREQFKGAWPFIGHSRPMKNQLACYLIGLARSRFLFTLEMGLGKTWLVLQLIHHYKNRERIAQQFLVVVPKKVHLGSWEDNINEHGFDLSFCGVGVQNIDKKWETLVTSTADVTVIDYIGFVLATTRKVGKKRVRDEAKVEKLQRKYKGWCLDEIHRVGNHDTLWYAVIVKAVRYATVVYGLTGTPTDRDPQKLWSQFYLCDRGEALGETLGVFRAAFFNEKANYFGGTDYKFDKAKTQQLRDFMQHSSIRYVQAECYDLPPLVQHPPEVFALPSDQRAKYNEWAQPDILEGGIRVAKPGVFHRMREICSGYMRIKKNGVPVTVTFDENPKLELLEEFVLQLPEGRKALVFFQYTESGRMIMELLERLKVPAMLLDGSTKDAQAWQRDFNARTTVRVGVINNDSGSEGLNVQTANYQAFFELPTSAITWQQALKRAHRTGQTQRVFVSYFLARGSVEEKLLRYLHEGRDLLAALSRGDKKATRDLLSTL